MKLATYSSDFFVGKVVIMFLESIANFATLAINHMSKVYLSNPDLYLGTTLLKKSLAMILGSNFIALHVRLIYLMSLLGGFR